MKSISIAMVCVVMLAAASAQSSKQHAAPPAKALEAKVRKAWEDYKNKNKDGFAAILADGFREVEEGGTGFADKKAVVDGIDQFDISQYTLKDFDVKAIGSNGALITYVAEYSGKYAGEPRHSKTAYGEVWTKHGNEWKAIYAQETNVK